MTWLHLWSSLIAANNARGNSEPCRLKRAWLVVLDDSQHCVAAGITAADKDDLIALDRSAKRLRIERNVIVAVRALHGKPPNGE